MLGALCFSKAVCDLGSRINLIPLSLFKRLGWGSTKSTVMQLLMANCTISRPIGILHDVLVNVKALIFLVDFVIMDCEVDFEVSIILGISFLANGCGLVHMEKG